tara:strand:+ start:87 stop:1625 length:1539 start_codon:yes stop_codon:yes gene_type:complete
MKLPINDPRPLDQGLYKIDIFNSDPIFSVKIKNETKNLYVKSWEEAFALHGDVFISDINPSYVAKLISENQTTQDSPYKRIKRLPRAHFVNLFGDGEIETFPYKPFTSGAPMQKEKDLHKLIEYLFQDKLSEIISDNHGKIGCELSSGIDSNAIVGCLSKGLGINPDKLFTWSHSGNGEEEYIKKFYEFHKLNISNCNLDLNEYKKENFSKSLKENLNIFGMPHQLGGNAAAIKYFNSSSCKILFSGFGGDQAISHHAINSATDLIKSLDIIEFYRWMDDPLKATKTMLGRIYGLINKEWQDNKFTKSISAMEKFNPLIKYLTNKGKEWLMPYINKEHVYEIDTYCCLHTSIRNRCMAEWIAVRVEEEKRLAEHHGMRKHFPFLDEKLIATLLNQDHKYFSEKFRKGRLIQRKAFAKYLPEMLQKNPSKFREGNNQWESIQRENQKLILSDLIVFSQNWNKILNNYWNLGEFTKLAINTEKHINNVDIALSGRVIKSLRILNTLSFWFSELE